MKRLRFVMVGGFLGAGKTTTIGRLARHYQERGQRVGVVTNDQAADLVDTSSLRSQGFGSPDEWLTKTKTDVVFAFFGYNESFKGKDGVEKFKTDMDSYVKNLLSKKYNGVSPPRVLRHGGLTPRRSPGPTATSAAGLPPG